MLATASKKDECWLYKQPTQDTCLIDKQSGKVTANIFKVPLYSILYVTSFNIKKNFKKFVKSDGTEYYKRLSLKEIVEVNDNFIFITKDTIINVSHVTKRCDWLYIWIEDQEFKISRSYKQSIIERFESFVL
ncbi:LytTR family transcriptional regulator DNA-binding domain-containing protein [Polaribacter sp. MSW13]|uniref:LytTR family transcriptional regulator DNA-binding domain-containing protein n=1 Tax=Polaribacter marinus TaxID=2916838 RepID=A0A9X2AKR0_9FLAO|nr:LytTR family transcriptional regulator DNA-binding domain-containing protein [Polaribacter marinus]MCI2230337.1 LytTR family transcriptional regulator DNA-binding domain-containing protein [Polaribacter marinus]